MLMVNQLIGFGAAVISPPPSIVFTQLATPDTSNSATYTFTSQGIGDAAVGRLVVSVGYIVSATNPIPALTSHTIGGSAATLIAQARTTQALAFMIALQVDAGTSLTIAVGNGDGGNLRCFLATYAIYDLNSLTAADFATTLTDSGSLACDTVPGSIVLAAAGETAAGTETCTWTGVTEQHETSSESASVFSSGMAIATVAEARTINANFSGSPTFVRGVAGVWR